MTCDIMTFILTHLAEKFVLSNSENVTSTASTFFEKILNKSLITNFNLLTSLHAGTLRQVNFHKWSQQHLISNKAAYRKNYVILRPLLGYWPQNLDNHSSPSLKLQKAHHHPPPPLPNYRNESLSVNLRRFK